LLKLIYRYLKARVLTGFAVRLEIFTQPYSRIASDLGMRSSVASQERFVEGKSKHARFASGGRRADPSAIRIGKMMPSEDQSRIADGVDDADDEAIADLPVFGIGDLAKEFGVSLRTLRFYEARGLLVPFREGGVRRYSARDRDRLLTILKGKRLGLTLSQIGMVLAESDGGASEGLKLSLSLVEQQMRALESQRDEIEQGLAVLRATHAKLLAARRPPEDGKGGCS